jgi:hypothetical protein
MGSSFFSISGGTNNDKNNTNKLLSSIRTLHRFTPGRQGGISSPFHTQCTYKSILLNYLHLTSSKYLIKFLIWFLQIISFFILNCTPFKNCCFNFQFLNSPAICVKIDMFGSKVFFRATDSCYRIQITDGIIQTCLFVRMQNLWI